VFLLVLSFLRMFCAASWLLQNLHGFCSPSLRKYALVHVHGWVLAWKEYVYCITHAPAAASMHRRNLVPVYGKNELEKKNCFPFPASLEKCVKTEHIPRPSDVGLGIYNTLKMPPHIQVFAGFLFGKKSLGSCVSLSYAPGLERCQVLIWFSLCVFGLNALSRRCEI
jgi:hypothetical protein